MTWAIWLPQHYCVMWSGWNTVSSKTMCSTTASVGERDMMIWKRSKIYWIADGAMEDLAALKPVSVYFSRFIPVAAVFITWMKTKPWWMCGECCTFVGGSIAVPFELYQMSVFFLLFHFLRYYLHSVKKMNSQHQCISRCAHLHILF